MNSTMGVGFVSIMGSCITVGFEIMVGSGGVVIGSGSIDCVSVVD
jgi:hypothetical protein